MKLEFEDETYAIRGACFEVYKEKGCGFLEGVYQECLEIELSIRKIPYIAQPELELFYKGKKLLERSIAESPNNIELIYYRYEIQRRIPKGLNYNHIKHDKELLEAFLKNIKNKNQDLSLYNQIKKTINTKT